MSATVSLSLLLKAAIPGLGLTAIGATWLAWGAQSKVVAATLFSLGVALFALVFFVVLTYFISSAGSNQEMILVFIGFTPIVYAACLFCCVRRVDFSWWSAAVCGFLGFVPLWFMGGFVLITSVCSFGTGGC